MKLSRMMHLCALVPLFTGQIVGATAAEQGAQNLTALRDCPARGRFAVCLPIEFRIYTSMGDKVTTKRNALDGSVGQFASVRGALEHRPQAAFRLVLQWPHNEFAHDIDLGGLAYLGRSKRDRPIILTDKGGFEILTKEIEVAEQSGLAVLNERSMKIEARYIRSYGLPFVVTRSGAIAVWDNRRRLCFKAPKKAPGRLVLLTDECAAAGIPADDELIGGAGIPVEDWWRVYQLTQAALSHAEAGDADVREIPNTGLVTIVPLLAIE